jgi:predicted TPR repeat methyltransferase
VQPADVNMVVERVGPLAPDQDQRYDLIVASNVLVYYGVFEQSLALANVASMLRPGGLFLTNDFVLPGASMSVVGYSDVPYTEAGDGDRIWWYERR